MTESSPATVAGDPGSPSQDEIWVTPLSNSCLDDVTLPPGGVSTRPLQAPPNENQQPIPRPDYLSHEGRDLRIDLIRGYFVFAMIIDHVRGESPLYLLTGGNRFFTSAAEGFILISGLVTGLVYRRIIKREGMSGGLFKVLSRAFTLYLLTVGVTLLFALFSEVAKMPWALGVSLADPLAFVISVFTMHQTYYLIDVMLLYTVLFLVAPLVFVLLDRGKVGWVLGGSVLLYVGYQFYPNLVILPWPIEGNALFIFSAWQILFFGGLVLGYYQRHIPTLGCRETRIGLIATTIGMALLVGLFFFVDPPTILMPHEIAAQPSVLQDVRMWVDEYVFSKADLRPGRLVASVITFSFLFFCATHFWQQIKRMVGWLLLPLGQSALYAYTAHIALAGLIGLAVKPLNLGSPGPQWLNALIQAGSILLIWFIVKTQWIKPTEKTRSLWHLAPAAFALVIVIGLWRFPLPDQQPTAQAALLAAGGDRTPRRYGTPVPKAKVNAPAAGVATSTPASPAPAATPAPAVQPTSSPQSEVASVTIGGTDLLSSPYLEPTNGSVHERWFYSPELDRDMPYYIYLPPNYEHANRRYPVLYMLHGLGGHREEWIAYGLINVADREISNGNIPPMIIVLPQGDRDYWVDHANDGPRWGEYIDRDLVTMIDVTYRTLRSPASRAIGGLSMGGYGALSHAFTRPDLYGVVGAHSPSLYEDNNTIPALGSGVAFDLRDPIYLAEHAAAITQLQVWVDVGKDDSTWLERATSLHAALNSRGLTHQWQVLPGGHDYDYWIAHILEYMRFYGHALTTQ